MTNTETSTLVFRDQAGEYFLLSRETLERSRVPAEQNAEVERLLAERGDVQGFLAPILVGVIIGEISVLAGYGIAKLVMAGRAIEALPTSADGIPTGHPETINTGGGPRPIH